MGGLILCRGKHYFHCKPIVFQIVSYDLILNELRDDFLKKPKLIGWAYCHSFFCIETWFISLQKKKLELTFRKELFASLFWSVTAETPCRKQEWQKFYNYLKSNSNVQGSFMIQDASLSVLCFTTKEASVYFLFLLKMIAQSLTCFSWLNNTAILWSVAGCSVFNWKR